MKGLLICSKKLLLLVDSPQIHPISSIQLRFTQKVVGERPFLLH